MYASKIILIEPDSVITKVKSRTQIVTKAASLGGNSWPNSA